MSLKQDKKRLDLYLKAEAAILDGSFSTEIKGMKFQDLSLKDVRDEIKILEERIALAEGSGGITVSQVVFGGGR